MRGQWRETAASGSITKKEEVVNLKACDEAERRELLAFGRQLVAGHMRIKVWPRLIVNGVWIFLVRVTRNPTAWPVLVRRVGLLRRDEQLEDSRATVRSQHGVECRFSRFLPEGYCRLAV